jgi:hypothetical protein
MRPAYFSGKSIPAFFLFYSTVYFTAAIPAFCLRREYDLLKQPAFYLKSLLFVVLYSVSVGFYSYRNWHVSSFSAEELVFVIKTVSNVKSILFVTIPLLAVKIFFDKKVEGLYGLSKNVRHIKVYLLALSVMLPFLVAASFSGNFPNVYPQFKPWLYNDLFGMTAILDKRAILPMVALYASVHFGKPIVETVSSMFGGYVLGVLAYQTKHIWGGVAVHIGVAFTMEIVGFLRHYLSNI